MTSQEDIIRNFRRNCTDMQNRINIIVCNFAINYKYVTWNKERDLIANDCILVDFSHHWYSYVMNVDHEFAALDWNQSSVQDTAGHSELKSLDGDFLNLKLTRINLQMWDHLLPEH